MGMRDKLQEDLKITGKVSFWLIRPDGTVRDHWSQPNLDTTAGKNEIRKQAFDSSQPAPFNYIALGTDASAPTITDTALGAEVGTRVQDASPIYPADGEIELETIFAPGNATGALKEAGLFNASSGGTMQSRIAIDKIKAADESLKVIWTKTVA